MKTMPGILLIVAPAFLYGCTAPRNPEAEQAAVAAATAWLDLVDSEKYGESWEGAAPFFKEAVQKGQWEQMMQSSRSAFGKNLSRKLKSARYQTSLPGAPDGQYVVIQFNTSFEHKTSAVETVTPLLDTNGQWRVSGYFIK